MSLSRRLAIALAAAGACQAVQMGFLPLERAPIRWSFFCAHCFVVLVFQVGAAVVFGDRFGGRLWSILAFVTPIALSLVSGRLLESVPRFWVFVAVCLLAAIGIFLPLLGRWNTAPLTSAAAGAVVAAEILRFRADEFRGFGTAHTAFLRPGVTALLALAAVVLSFRLPERHRLPSTRGALAVAGVGLAVAAGLGGRSDWTRTLAAGGVRPNAGPPIVLIVLDTVRADHLRSYGYTRDTMPSLDEFGRRFCLRAERSITVHPSSLEAHASLFTGLYPPRHGAHRPFLEDKVTTAYAYALAERYTTLAELLKAAGYWTVALSGNAGPLSPELGLSQGFDLYRAVPEDLRSRTPWHAPFQAPGPALSARIAKALPASWSDLASYKPYRSASVITDEAIGVLDAAAGRPIFLFLNYFDAHHPNAPPPPFLDAFPGRLPDSAIDGSYESVGQFYGPKRHWTVEDERHLSALYDGELAYIDSELERLFTRLRQDPRFGEMLVVVVADHGESLGEHGLLGHGHGLYEAQIAVPFFAKPGRTPAPLQPPGTLTGGVVESVDVFPTILEGAGLPVPEDQDGLAWGVGRTVARAWSYRAKDHSSRDPKRFDRELRSVEVEGLKLIQSSWGTLEFYDIKQDPLEERDLSKDRPEDVARLLALLGREDRSVGADHPAEVDSTVQERLRSLGYVQ